ncbi:hypothetical protein HYW18_01260 [Candidatus Uhrbacteria bacterium]|nr:hypothetical protein [Candidatus Uhrbacteria bacterium]
MPSQRPFDPFLVRPSHADVVEELAADLRSRPVRLPPPNRDDRRDTGSKSPSSIPKR